MRRTAALLTACLLLLLAACGGGQRESVQEMENPSVTATADVTEGGRLLAEIAGTYQELFPVTKP